MDSFESIVAERTPNIIGVSGGYDNGLEVANHIGRSLSHHRRI